MKKIIITIAFALIAISTFAQTAPLLRPRMEIAEVSSESTGTDIEVFYMHDESPRVYYLSLGRLGIGSDIVQVEFDPFYELFIPLGSNLDEAIDKMETINDFYDLPNLGQTEVLGSFAVAYPTDKPVLVTVTCRRLLFSRLLEFSLPTDTEGLVRATHIHRSNFRSLLGALKFYRKLHPDE